MTRRWRARADRIRRDTHSGASELALKAAQVLDDFLRADTAAASRGAWREEFIDLALALAAFQPSMAPILRLVNGALIELREDGGVAARRAVLRFLEGYRRALRARGRLIAAHFLPLLGDGMTVLVYSWSSTIFHVLRQARQAGKRFQAVCPEARPGREGLRMARELGRNGVEVQILIDALAPWWLRHCQLAIVGADSVSRGGLVNKAGTFALALGARAARTPFYALTGTEKLVPAGLQHRLRIAGGPPGEVLPGTMRRVSAVNVYFDVTPLKYLTGVVTEEGRLSPAAVRAQLEGVPVSPLLTARALR